MKAADDGCAGISPVAGEVIGFQDQVTGTTRGAKQGQQRNAENIQIAQSGYGGGGAGSKVALQRGGIGRRFLKQEVENRIG